MDGGIYLTHLLIDPFVYATIILCILFGEKYYSHFKESCVPLMREIVNNGLCFNWRPILSRKFSEEVMRVMDSSLDSLQGFHMTSYFVDIIFETNPLLGTR